MTTDADFNQRVLELAARGEKLGCASHFSDAFKKYPVENEWHKGKVENILKRINKIVSK